MAKNLLNRFLLGNMTRLVGAVDMFDVVDFVGAVDHFGITLTVDLGGANFSKVGGAWVEQIFAKWVEQIFAKLVEQMFQSE